MSVDDQSTFRVRFDWGLNGLGATSADAAVAIVDVLCFTTCVSIACSRGAAVYPCEWNDERAADLATRSDAVLAAKRGEEAGPSGKFTLSPPSLLAAYFGLRLVLPSPNGSALAVAAQNLGIKHVVAGCLRNATAVATWLASAHSPVAVIAAGERWYDGSMRFALEDLLGAGAILSALPGSRSAEAEAAVAAFNAHRSSLSQALAQTASGRELIEWRYPSDITLAAELDPDGAVPLLRAGAFQAIG